MRLFTARWVLPVSAPALSHGAVVVHDGRIVAAGPPRDLSSRYPEAERVDLGPAVVLPGLVNAHTHLELCWLADDRPPGGSYVGWLRGLLERLHHDDGERERRCAGPRVTEMIERGTVAVGDISNRLGCAGLLARSPLSGVLFHEIYGMADDESAVERAAARLDATARSADWREAGDRWRLALTPHAPHTGSVALLRALAGRATASGEPLSIHVAESRDERRLLVQGDGPLAELSRERAFLPDGWQPPRRAPLEHLQRTGVLSSRTLAVHCVDLDRNDLKLLQAARATVVTCPRSNAYLDVGVAPVPALLKLGIPVALGTDSLASCPDLDLFGEMAELRRRHPDLPPAAIVRMATLNGALALGIGDRLGSIEPGKESRLIVVPLADDAGHPFEALCSVPERVVPIDRAAEAIAS